MPKKPRPKSLDDFTRSGVSWQPIERTVAYDLLSIAAESGRKFTEGMATADLMFWKNAGKVQTVRYYAARWKWGKSVVHRLMQQWGMAETPDEARDNAGQSGDNAGQNTRKTNTKTKVLGQSGDNAGQARDSIKERRDLEKEIGVGEGAPKTAPARSKARPADVETVVEFLRSQGAAKPEWVAAKWWDHYSANGWKVGRNDMKDWQAAARKWLRNEPNFQNGTSNGSATGHSPRPQTSTERRLTLDLETVRADRRKLFGLAEPGGREPDPDIEGRTAVNGG